MSPVALIGAQAGVVILGVVLAWILATRFLPARWSSIGWGALCFPLSQVARFAVVIPLSLLLSPVLGESWVVAAAILMVLTSGIFEESARWLVLRFMATGTRSWTGGVAFGLGHGGIEAILLIGMSAISTLSLLLTADAGLLDPSTMPADVAEQVQAQLDALASLSPLLVGLGVYERVLAIVFHVAMSLLVLLAVMRRRWTLWALAVALHCAFNALAIVLLPGAIDGTADTSSAGALLPLYAALTAASLVALWAVWRGPLSRPRVDGTDGSVGLHS